MLFILPEMGKSQFCPKKWFVEIVTFTPISFFLKEKKTVLEWNIYDKRFARKLEKYYTKLRSS